MERPIYVPNSHNDAHVNFHHAMHHGYNSESQLLRYPVVASCVTCTDPILSQAVAEGPFADKYVSRHLREIISAEPGVNDGFGFPFMMLAVYLLRFASGKTDLAPVEDGRGGHDLLFLAPAAGEEVGRQGDGAGEALKQWFIETWTYYCLLGAVYGAVIDTGWRYAIKMRSDGD